MRTMAVSLVPFTEILTARDRRPPWPSEEVHRRDFPSANSPLLCMVGAFHSLGLTIYVRNLWCRLQER